MFRAIEEEPIFMETANRKKTRDIIMVFMYPIHACDGMLLVVFAYIDNCIHILLYIVAYMKENTTVWRTIYM